MTADEAARRVSAHWLGKAVEALASAAAELSSGRVSFALNRCYYACFYTASAVMALRGARFVKHSGLRASIHRDLVKSGELPAEIARMYDRLFALRQQADYTELTSFSVQEGEEAIREATQVVAALRDIAASSPS